MSTTATATRHHCDSLARLAVILTEATAEQWATPARPSSPNGGGPVRTSGHADPTASVGGNPDRLALRAAVLRAESALAVAADALNSASDALETALAPYRQTTVRVSASP
ncbi:DUF7169 domain-containing protein [Agromyces sp. SYSU T00266]|uniref:DUF7169 domain-containing protein n=1 Tax=Agromyces zhanjiangensis TaxID=3158562 RepID=UPI003396D1FF